MKYPSAVKLSLVASGFSQYSLNKFLPFTASSPACKGLLISAPLQISPDELKSVNSFCVKRKKKWIICRTPEDVATLLHGISCTKQVSRGLWISMTHFLAKLLNIDSKFQTTIMIPDQGHKPNLTNISWRKKKCNMPTFIKKLDLYAR